MKRSSLLLSLFLVFASGLLVGALGYHLYTAEATAKAKTERHWDPAEWRRRYTETMCTRLDLTDEQAAQLNTILDETKARFDALEEEMAEASRPKKRAIRKQQVDAIKQVLTPEQLAEYEKLHREHTERHRKARLERERRKHSSSPNRR